MIKKAISFPVVLLVIFLTGAGIIGRAGQADRAFLRAAFTERMKSDPLFLEEYSARLNVQLDSTCDPLFVATIAGWIGTPYRHAGYSKSGIDCSGFVSHIYKDVYNIDLTHSACAMIYQMKTLVKRSQLRMGDIIFFRIHGHRISHVGIYLKDNKFVHASLYRGIAVDDLTAAYYKKAYYIAGRPGGYVQ